MKKLRFTALAIVLILILTASACDNSTTPASTPPPAPSASSAPSAQVPAPPPPASAPQAQDPVPQIQGLSSDDFAIASLSGDGSEAGMTVIRGISVRFNGIHEELSWDELSDIELEKDSVRIALDRSDFEDAMRRQETDNNQTIFTLLLKEPVYEIATYSVYFKHNGIQRQSPQPNTLIPGYTPPPAATPAPPSVDTPPPATTTPPPATSNVVIHSSPQIIASANDSSGYFGTMSNNYLYIRHPHSIYGLNRNVMEEIISFDENGRAIYRVQKYTFEVEQFAQSFISPGPRGEISATVGSTVYFVVDTSDSWTKQEWIDTFVRSGWSFTDSMP